MSRLDDQFLSLSSDSHPVYAKLPQIISTIAFLLLGYYVLSSSDAWPSTTKRSLYELTIRAIPSQAIYLLQYVTMRLAQTSDQDSLFRPKDFGDFRAKEEALQRMLSKTQIPSVLNRARTLSGYDKLLPVDTDTSPPGLGNWDNSCYQNSVLQGLASLPAFQHYVYRSLLLCEKAKVDADTTQTLNLLLDQLSDTSFQKRTLWTPKTLKSMDSWQQQDAQEYFSRILESIEKETLRYEKVLSRKTHPGLSCLRHDGPSPNTDNERTAQKFIREFTKNPMDGMLAQMLACQECGFSEGVSLSQFNCLTLNMGLGGQRDLEDLLNEYTERELIDGVECDNCTKVAHKQESADAEESEQDSQDESKKKQKVQKVLRTKAKQTTLGRLPQDLLFHINRSIWDDYGNQVKNPAFIHFPTKLDFLGRWCAPLEAGSETVQAVYELKCIVTHSGRHDNGHYVAYGKRDKKWYCFNDEIVTQMTEQEVLNRGNVFMLFYEALDRSELMAPDEDQAIQAEATTAQSTGSPPGSSTESEVYEVPTADAPQATVPTMRTASEDLSPVKQEASAGPPCVPAV